MFTYACWLPISLSVKSSGVFPDVKATGDPMKRCDLEQKYEFLCVLTLLEWFGSACKYTIQQNTATLEAEKTKLPDIQ